VKPLPPSDLAKMRGGNEGDCPCGGTTELVRGLGKPVDGGPCKRVEIQLCRSGWCGHPRSRELRSEYGEQDEKRAAELLKQKPCPACGKPRKWDALAHDHWACPCGEGKPKRRAIEPSGVGA